MKQRKYRQPLLNRLWFGKRRLGLARNADLANGIQECEEHLCHLIFAHRCLEHLLPSHNKPKVHLDLGAQCEHRVGQEPKALECRPYHRARS